MAYDLESKLFKSELLHDATLIQIRRRNLTQAEAEYKTRLIKHVLADIALDQAKKRLSDAQNSLWLPNAPQGEREGREKRMLRQ